jgi:hypothetical protein
LDCYFGQGTLEDMLKGSRISSDVCAGAALSTS